MGRIRVRKFLVDTVSMTVFWLGWGTVFLFIFAPPPNFKWYLGWVTAVIAEIVLLGGASGKYLDWVRKKAKVEVN